MKKILLLAVSLPAVAALGQCSIDGFTIGGGGGVSTGGAFAIAGLIGQPDAGQMRGGNFAVTGGLLALPVAVQTPEAPRLVIVPGASAGTAKISWAPGIAGFVLQESTGLAPANWSDSASGTNNPVTVPAVLPTRFYRLLKP